MRKYKVLFSAVILSSVVMSFTACNGNTTTEYDIQTPTEQYSTSSYSDYNVSSEDYEEYEESNVNISEKVIDPFEGLEVQFDGISPYCIISFNNSKCSLEVQNNVEYSISKEEVTTSGYFKNGEEVTVYAFLNFNGSFENDNERYSLSSTERKYKVKDVPEYITEITDDIDFTQFKSELKDYYDSITAWKEGDYHVFETTKGYFVSKSDEKEYDTYFSNLKVNKYNTYSKDTPFNKIDVTFSVKIANTSYEAYNVFDPTPGVYFTEYFTIYAENIVRYPDGRIAWGRTDPNELDFHYKVNSNNMNDLINDIITSKKSDYNSEKISDKNIKIF